MGSKFATWITVFVDKLLFYFLIDLFVCVFLREGEYKMNLFDKFLFFLVGLCALEIKKAKAISLDRHRCIK